jgi:membrane protease YdiL (CAAX protease family)
MFLRTFLSPKFEPIVIFSGLCAFVLLYYRQSPVGIFLGILTLLATGSFWGYTIRFVNPLKLQDFRISSKRILPHVVIGTFTGTLGWILQEVIIFRQFGYWTTWGSQPSFAVVISILMVVIAEEVFFRGYLLTRILTFTGEAWLNILLICIAWSLYKVLIHLWKGYPSLFYLGLFFTEIYLTIPYTWWAYHTGSITAPFASHLVWDYLVYGSRSTIPEWVF